MQNFTLRFKGKMFYLLILSLFIGNLPSVFGQSCPTVSDTEQEFCYLATVSDLEATAASGKTLRWYRTASSTNPIPNNEILEDGTYFAGNQDGSCTTRQSVNVTVNDLGAPVSQFGNFYEPCIYNTADETTVADLKALITTADPSYDINVYEEEYGDSSTELADDVVLVAGENYFIGQDDPASTCQYSSRIAVEYNPVEAFAPNATAAQQFCESDEPTVADLTASGTSPNTQAFRWYSTATSAPALAPSTPLVDGETYYVSQIVNRTNSTQPPCESTERTMVTVEVLASDAGPDNTDNVLCVSEADSELNDTTNARNYFISLLENNSDSDPSNEVPTDGTFSGSSLAEIVADYNDGTKTGTYQTTYTVTFPNGCEDSVILGVTVEEDPNPGESGSFSVCETQIAPFFPVSPFSIAAAEAFIIDYINDSGIDPGGVFSPSVEDYLTLISNDLSNDALPQTYDITYTVDNNGCVASSTLSLTIQDEADAGTDATATLCENEVIDQGIFDSEASLRDYYVTLLGAGDTNGSFNPSLATLINQYNDGVTAPSEDFTTDYTVDNGVCPPVTTSATLTINAAIPAVSGPIGNQVYCNNDSAITLTSLLDGSANPNGVFSSDDATVSGGSFDPTSESAGVYSITYTVSPETACVSDTATTTFTVTVNEEADAGTDNSATLCENEVEEEGIFTDVASLEAYYLNLLGTTDDRGSFSPDLATVKANYDDGVSSPSEDFMVTYTVDPDGCDPASATATLTVNAAIPAETGTIANQTYCSNETSVALSTLLDGSANPNGVFSSDNADVTDGNFDPSDEGAGVYTITYTVSPETACVSDTATTTFSITVNQAPNAGPGGEFTFCQGEFEAIAAQALVNPSALLNEFGSDITAGGDFSSENLSTLLAQYSATTEFPASLTTTYTVSNENCTDAATYTVTITPNEEVNAGGNQSVTFCTTDGTQDLNDFLGDDATPGGSFENLPGGSFNPTAAGVFTFEYTVTGDSDPCLEGTDTAIITVTVEEGPDAGEPVSDVICEDAIADDFFTEPELTAFYLGLLEDGVPTDGTFDPSIASLISQYNGGMTTGDFVTNYTISNDNDCEASVELTLTVREAVPADLTEVSDPAPICQNAGIQDLTDFIGDNPDFGVFDGYADQTLDPASLEPGDYEITYTLDQDETECVTGSDSITFTITILESVVAGPDETLTVCNNGGVRNLFDLLNPGVDTNGEFVLSGSVLVNGEFDPTTFSPGVYPVEYIVTGTNDCGDDSATFTITVNNAPEAGPNTAVTYCLNAGVQDLTDVLADGTPDNGFFILGENTINGSQFNPSNYEPGVYPVEYIVSNSTCSDFSIITVTITDAANAGEDMELEVCSNDGVQNLFDFLSAEADTNGEFTINGTVIANGEMNPADFAAGTYEVTYTVPEENDCGEDSATFTITVKEAPAAPEVNDLSFCAIQSPTGADLFLEGEDLTFYTDAELSMMVAAEDALVTATYYVTQRSEEGCESDATAFDIIINDPGTPTIDDPNLTFCEYDDATVADLSAAVDQTSNVSWFASAEGTSSLSTATPLQSGVYYASLYDPATDCDSSQRLAVTVTIEECPLLFPEGISPNGDGMNDTFDIENIEREYPNYTIEIRNRWGDVVYKGNANTPDWDGTTSESGSFGDDVLPVGVYFYLLDFNDGATAPRRGKVYLSR